MLVANKFDRLDDFINKIKKDIYKESPTNIQTIESGISSIRHLIKEGQRILDVGCGNGEATKIFKELDTKPIGITLDKNDLTDDSVLMDMSFLEFEDNTFDGIWARHSLEHSIFPYYTLHELSRVLKYQGWIYVEVPATETCCNHESNRNHYSIMSLTMWGSLMDRVGFKYLEPYELDIRTHDGQDIYYRIIGIKK